MWRPLAGIIEARWEQRFGTDEIDNLRASLRALVRQFDVDLPRHLPVAGVPKQDHAEWAPCSEGDVAPGLDLSALLSQVLLAFTIDFERESRLAHAISANALRVLTEQGVRIKDLPRVTGVSVEAISASVKFLERHDCVVVEPDPAASRAKLARLTPKGQKAHDKCRHLLGLVEERWRPRFGEAEIDRLRESLEGLVDQRTGEQFRLPKDWCRTRRVAGARALRDPDEGHGRRA